MNFTLRLRNILNFCGFISCNKNAWLVMWINKVVGCPKG